MSFANSFGNIKSAGVRLDIAKGHSRSRYHGIEISGHAKRWEIGRRDTCIQYHPVSSPASLNGDYVATAKVRGTDQRSSVTLAMQNSRGFSFSSPYFSSASTTAKSAVSLVESRMVLYGMLGFRLSAYMRRVPPARRHDASF